jgi:hypothetical protein
MFKGMKQYKWLIMLGVIVLVAFLVRVWAFDDLLTFKMDQARDIKLVEDAYVAGGGKLNLEGVGELPLLGPRAAKTYLRLGPAAYYFEYLSLLVFGDKPWAMVIPDFIFSILTIPLFYYFLRQAFSKRVSLMTTAVFASSFFLTQYGRFAWNPNSIPFWSLVYFLGLYKVVYGSWFMVRGSGKWLLVAVIGYGVASQLHFTAMLAYPLIGGIFILGSLFIRQITRCKSQDANYKVQMNDNKEVRQKNDLMDLKTPPNSRFSSLRPANARFDPFYTGGEKRKKFRIRDLMLGISWKYWLGAVAILGIMYLPMMLSEVCTHGDNWVQFKYALSGRGKEEFPLKAKLIQSLKLHSEYFWFSLTSISGGANSLGVMVFLGGIFLLGGIFIKEFFVNFEFKILKLNSIFNDLILNLKNRKSNSIGKRVSKFDFPCFSILAHFFQKPSLSVEVSEDKALRTISKSLFFLLIWIWFGVMFLLYTKLAFNVIKPRYWLLEAPIFFVWLASVLQWVDKSQVKFKQIIRYKISAQGGPVDDWQEVNKFQETRYPPKVDQPIASKRQANHKIEHIVFKQILNLTVMGLAVVNLWAVGNWYWMLQNQQDGSLPMWELKLKDENRVPWGQLQKVADYVEGLSNETEKDVCFYATGEYRPVYDYIFSRRGLSEKIRRMSFKNDSNKNCLFITIDHHRHREIPRIPKDHKDEFEKIENGKREVGFVTVWRVRKKIQNTKYKIQTIKNMAGEKKQGQGAGNEKKEIEEKTVEVKEKIKKPRRKERVRWKDVFECR